MQRVKRAFMPFLKKRTTVSNIVSIAECFERSYNRLKGPLDASVCQLGPSGWAEEGHPVLQLSWTTLHKEGNIFYGDRQAMHSVLNKDKDWLLQGEPAYFKTGHI